MRSILASVCAGLVLLAGLAGPAAAAAVSATAAPPATGVAATKPRTCPRGETLSGDRCVARNGCAVGEVKTNGVCACPAGKQMIHGRCVGGAHACPAGGQLENDQCVATPTCPKAYHMGSSGMCVARPR